MAAQFRQYLGIRTWLTGLKGHLAQPQISLGKMLPLSNLQAAKHAWQARLDVADIRQGQARDRVHQHALPQSWAPPRAPCSSAAHLSPQPQRSAGPLQVTVPGMGFDAASTPYPTASPTPASNGNLTENSFYAAKLLSCLTIFS